MTKNIYLTGLIELTPKGLKVYRNGARNISTTPSGSHPYDLLYFYIPQIPSGLK